MIVFIERQELGKGLLLQIRNVFVTGSYFHLWFVLALIYGVIVVVSSIKVIGFMALQALFLVLWVLGLLGDSCRGLLGSSAAGIGWDWISFWVGPTRNGLFFAPIFLIIGFRVWRSSRCHSLFSLVSGVCLSSIGLFAEALRIKKLGWVRDHNMYISLVPLAWFVFMLALRIETANWSNWISRKSQSLGELSLNIYLVHGSFLFGFSRILTQAAPYGNAWGSLIYFGLVLFASVLASICIMKIRLAPFSYLRDAGENFQFEALTSSSFLRMTRPV